MTSSTFLARPEETKSNALSHGKTEPARLLLTDKPLSELVFTNCNPLASAATPRLLLLSQIKTMEEPDNVAEFHWHVRQSIENYELYAQKNHCEPRIILATRYCLCTAIDEMILCTSWGGQSLWPEQTLLSLIHKETWGGERFFLIFWKR